MAVPLIAGGLTLLGKLAEPIIDALFETEAEKAEAKTKVMAAAHQMDLAQISVNLKEALHESIFVAGWRPFIGWVCGSALAYTYIGQPLLTYILIVSGVDVPELPKLSLGELMPVLMGMLGLGYLRTQEKMKGVNTNR
jgi:hypothetical protein